MAERPDPERGLLERLAAGDRAALARVTRLVTSRLRRLGAYDLRDEWDDLCQEVVWALLRAVKSGRSGDVERTVAYINRITWNRFVDWLRSRGIDPARRQTRSQDRSQDNRADGDGRSIEALASRAPDPDERVAARQALAKLPAEWQSLLVEHYVEDVPVKRLVELTGMSRATLNRRLRQAREAFRGLLDGTGKAQTDPTDADDDAPIQTHTGDVERSNR